MTPILDFSTERDIFWKEWKPTARTCLCFIRRGEEVLLMRKKRGSGAGKINAPGGHLESGETPLMAAIRETEEELGVTPLNLQLVGELSFQFVDAASPSSKKENVEPDSKVASPHEMQGTDKRELQHSGGLGRKDSLLLDFLKREKSKNKGVDLLRALTPDEHTSLIEPLISNTELPDGRAMHTMVFLAEDCCGEPQESEEAVPYWYHFQKIPYQEMWEDDKEWLPGMLEGKRFRGYYFFDQEKMLSGHLEWE